MLSPLNLSQAHHSLQRACVREVHDVLVALLMVQVLQVLVHNPPRCLQRQLPAPTHYSPHPVR